MTGRVQDETAIRRAVVGYLREHGRLPALEESELAGFAYLDEGALDSFGIVDMVMKLESELDVRLSPEDMQSDEFRTIGGLVALLTRRARETGGG